MDERKVVALVATFFFSFSPLIDSHHAAIDFEWGRHCRPGARDFVELSLAEVWDAVRAMPLASSRA